MAFSIETIYAALRQSSPRGDGKFYSLTKGNMLIRQLDTPQLWGHDPAVMNYIPAAGNLTAAIEGLIASATRTVDISCLFPFPSGLFRHAIRNGLRAALLRTPALRVRITVGYYVPIPPASVAADPTTVIDAFIKSLDLPDTARVQLDVALMQTWATSWNHGKLIIVDGQHAICGGHNLWSDDYTQFAPVSDVSFEFAGPAARTGEAFINNIWTRMWYDVNDANRRETPPLFWARSLLQGKIGPAPLAIFSNPPPAHIGPTAMLALARVGINLEPLFPITASDNASLMAKLVAVTQCKGGHIRMSQQMLGGSPLGDYDMQFFPALCQHLLDGGQLTLIISDTGATTMTHDSYSGDGIEATARRFALAIRTAVPGMPRDQLIALLTQQLHIGPTRIYNRQPGDPQAKSWMWRNPQTGEMLEPANHAKIMIFDGAGFYFGSDNAYAMPFNPFGMQEFGYMVEGQGETSAFLRDYWDQAWGYSYQFQVTDWARIVDEIPTAPGANTLARPT